MTNFDAKAWLNKVLADDFNVDVKATGIVRIYKSFTPGDTNAYTGCDMMAPGYLAELPQTQPGSVWGTDGASVGGYSGLKNGHYVLNKSGVSKRVCKALMKAM